MQCKVTWQQLGKTSALRVSGHILLYCCLVRVLPAALLSNLFTRTNLRLLHVNTKSVYMFSFYDHVSTCVYSVLVSISTNS